MNPSEDGEVPDDASALTVDETLQLREIEALLADESVWAQPPAALEASVVEAISSEAISSATLPAGASTQNYFSYGKPSRRRSLFTGFAAGAAAAAAAIGVIALAGRADEPQPDFATTMEGTELAAGFSGPAKATITPTGVFIDVAVPGLPRRDGGEFYEMWLKSCDGSLLVPAGTFHDLDEAVGWAGVDPLQFPILTVTRERAAAPVSADQGSSGEVVLRGQLGPCPES